MDFSFTFTVCFDIRGTNRNLGPFDCFNALVLLCEIFLLLDDFLSLEAPCLLRALVIIYTSSIAAAPLMSTCVSSLFFFSPLHSTILLVLELTTPHQRYNIYNWILQLLAVVRALPSNINVLYCMYLWDYY